MRPTSEASRKYLQNKHRTVFLSAANTSNFYFNNLNFPEHGDTGVSYIIKELLLRTPV